MCRIIAGPNGAGKTTFALTYLRQFPEAQSFVNADLIAAGLSPLAPQLQLVAASRLMLAEIEGHVTAGRSFAFETTLSGRGYQLNAYAPAVDHMLCNMKSGPNPAPVFSQSGAERTILDPVLYAQLLALAR